MLLVTLQIQIIIWHQNQSNDFLNLSANWQKQNTDNGKKKLLISIQLARSIPSHFSTISYYLDWNLCFIQ